MTAMGRDAALLNQVRPLLSFIGQLEGLGDYRIVWARIAERHRPPKPLTQMTIGEVLAWQDRIDPLYRSEAAGVYQILEDTLRNLYPEAGLQLDDLFDRNGQDRLALALMRRRGLDRFLAGQLSVNQFCNELAKEWASLPVVTPVRRAQRDRVWTVPPGASYYRGDGLNTALTPTAPFIAAVTAIRPAIASPPKAPTPAIVDGVLAGDSGLSPEDHGGFWAGLAARILAPFRNRFGG